MARTALPTLPRSGPRETWLELALDYRCNLRCLGCHACHDTGETMATATALEALRAGRARGTSRLWLGGGEPTLRGDLLGLIRAARALGFEDVLLQTNGMRLSYAAYRDAVLSAGVTELRFNVKSHRAEAHDRLSGAACHGLLVAALEGLATTPTEDVVIAADVLLARATVGDLPELIPFYAERGVTRFVLWLLSASDSTDPDVLAEVPTFSELIPSLAGAARRASVLGVELQTLHTPPCTLPAELRPLFSPAMDLGLTVLGPDGRGFPLEGSPFEGGAYLPGCTSCRERVRCGGPRADYVSLHGSAEFTPLPFALESSA